MCAGCFLVSNGQAVFLWGELLPGNLFAAKMLTLLGKGISVVLLFA
jgi:hypothetical protein